MKLGKIKSHLVQASQAQNLAKEQLNAAWEIFDEIAASAGYPNTAEAKNNLGVMHVYASSITEGIITHGQFTQLEQAIKLLAQNNKAAQDLLEVFAMFAPIPNADLMATKLSAQDAIGDAIEETRYMLKAMAEIDSRMSGRDDFDLLKEHEAVFHRAIENLVNEGVVERKAIAEYLR